MLASRIIVDYQLLLRGVALEDANWITHTVRKHYVTLQQFLPWAIENYSLEDALGFVERSIQEFHNERGAVFSLLLNGQLVGLVSIKKHNFMDSVDAGIVGYWLSPEYEGLGAMTRSVKALIESAVQAQWVGQVFIFCSEFNLKSKAVAERCGLVKVGVIPKGNSIRGVAYNVLMYATVPL